MCSGEIRGNKGGSIPFSFNWKESDGVNNLDLTDWTLEIFDSSSELAGLIEVSIPDSGEGLISGVINWGSALSTISKYTFRLRITHDTEDPLCTELITVVFQ